MRLVKPMSINFCYATEDDQLPPSILLSTSYIPEFNFATAGYNPSVIFSSTDMMIEFDR